MRKSCFVGWVKRVFERRPTGPAGTVRPVRWAVARKASLDPPYKTGLFALLAVTIAASPAPAQVAPPVPPIPTLPKVVPPDSSPTDPPTDPDENPLTIAERGVSNAKNATEKLANNDAGTETQAAQKRTLKAIDDLLKKNDNPPPMGGGGGGSAPPPMGGGQQPPPMGGGGGGGAKPPSPAGGGGQQPPPTGGGQQPMPMGQGSQPMPTGGQPMPIGQQPAGGDQRPMGGNAPGQGGSKSPPGVPLPERITKDVWGHLPPQLRQQMSQFYRERFMPKYSELLRQYYSSLAEKEKEKKK